MIKVFALVIFNSTLYKQISFRHDSGFFDCFLYLEWTCYKGNVCQYLLRVVRYSYNDV